MELEKESGSHISTEGRKKFIKWMYYFCYFN